MESRFARITKPVVWISSIALACSLCPALAHANETTQAPQRPEAAATLTASATATQPALQTQAAKRKMRVLICSYDPSRGKNQGTKYSYDSKGRIKKVTTFGTITTNKYSGFKLVSTKAVRNNMTSNVFVEDSHNYYNKKGQLVKRTFRMLASTTRYTTKYTYDKKGRLAKTVSYSGASDKRTVNTYKYSNGGRTVKIAQGNQGATRVDKYSKKGYLVQQGGTKYKLTYYSDGLPKTRTDQDGRITKYEYKTISVPKQCVDHVKQQQKDILN